MSDVFFVNVDDNERMNYIAKLTMICEKLRLNERIEKNQYVAIKVHMGERGNTCFIPPWYVSFFVEYIKSLGAKPFITDTNVLYRGNRTNAIDHLNSVTGHGYNYATFGAPVIIADGLVGNSGVKVEIDGNVLKSVEIAEALYNSDFILCLSHFKGHMITSIGGALKNLGMGAGTRSGKLEMHSNAKPFVVDKKCTACKRCMEHCPVDAISLSASGKAVIDKDKCIGCADCIAVCRFDAVQFSWDGTSQNIQEKMVDHFAGCVKNKPNKVAYFNFLINMSPLCDCFGFSGQAITEDIGIIGSNDPVAIDKASLDLVTKRANKDVFKILFPNYDANVQLKAAEKLNLGTTKYTVHDLTKNQPHSSLHSPLK